MTLATSKFPAAVLDSLNRPLRSLRVSVIDRCDLRCRYCMPEEEYSWLPKESLLDFGEIATAIEAFAELGVRRVRITGGEPLLRAGLPELIARIAAMPAIEDLAMTTNGTQLARLAAPLQRAGLQRVTISLDSLRAERLKELTRRDALPQVLAGIDAAAAAGFAGLKINTVVMRGFNDDELVDLIEYGKRVGGEVRFIEYMDVGGATHWSQAQVMDRGAIIARLEEHYGPIAVDGEQGAAPAARFRLSDGTRFGIIASVSAPFCSACDRSRLTADGLWYLCLYAQNGYDLRSLLRAGGSGKERGEEFRRDELLDYMRGVWSRRDDRGAEERVGDPARGALYQVADLQADPHREMHTRGG